MTIQKDLDTVQAGILKAVLIAEGPDNKENAQASKQFMMNELEPLINAGFRVLGSLFVNLERLANAQEERLNHEAR